MRKILSAATTRDVFNNNTNSSRYNSIDDDDNDDSILVDSQTTTTIDINHNTTTKMNTKPSISRFYSNPHLLSLASSHHHDDPGTHSDPHIHYQVGTINASNTNKSAIASSSTNNYPTNVKDAYIDTIKTHFFYLGLSSGSALQVTLPLNLTSTTTSTTIPDVPCIIYNNDSINII